ncbi:MAG: sigma 54-interacting transcriptional regulator [Syntrophaceae bacterium]|nr:sigma 54-interacting transcriptional regulator [Syntrophaceae bacterium]
MKNAEEIRPSKRPEKRDEKSRVSAILESIADGVFTIGPDWRITSFNRAAERITGVSRRKALGQKCFDVFHANICQTACALKKTLETGREIIDLPVDILNSKGETLPISISTAVLRDEKGKIIGGAETFRDLSAIEALRRELSGKFSSGDIVSKNEKVQKILALLSAVAESNSTVLIQGPSGSGKELLARAIHSASPRAKGPYVVVSCGALPDTLLESELFGYVKGAFTDAKKDKPGRFARAEKGTLFLDEIGDISPAVQVKLLRFLQEKEYEPLGAVRPQKADVRVVAATNKDLARMVQEGRFREDLYYRLNVVKLELPSLSERREDIPLLVEHFLKRFNVRMNKRVSSVSPEVMQLFMRYDFPGNIRELENALEHAFVLCNGTQIREEHLPQELLNRARGAPLSISSGRDVLKQTERQTLLKVLEKHGGNRKKTAADLGISPVTLWRKLKSSGI